MRRRFPAVTGKPAFVIDIARSLQAHQNPAPVARLVKMRQTNVLLPPMAPISIAAPNILRHILSIRHRHGMGDTDPGIQITAIDILMGITVKAMDMVHGVLEILIMGMGEAVAVILAVIRQREDPAAVEADSRRHHLKHSHLKRNLQQMREGRLQAGSNRLVRRAPKTTRSGTRTRAPLFAYALVSFCAGGSAGYRGSKFCS